MSIIVKSDNLSPRVQTFGDLYDDPDAFDRIIGAFPTDQLLPEIDTVDDLASVTTRSLLRAAFNDPELTVGYVR